MAKRKPKAVASTAKSDSRLAVNLLSAAMTVLVLFAATEAVHGGLSNSINKIGRNFSNLTDYAPAYSNYTESEKYHSRIRPFNPRGMAVLYDLTVRLMDVLLPKDFLLEDFGEKLSHIFFEGVLDDVPNLLETYWPFFLMVVALVLPIVLIPLCGILFCCCRSCGICGPRSQQHDKKQDHRKEKLLAMLLVVLATALLFCTDCTFTSNKQMQNGLDKLSETARTSIADANTYLESARKQAKHLFVTNYNEFFNVFNQTVNKSSKNVMEQLEIRSNASAMMDLHAFVGRLPKMTESLETLEADTNSMQAFASQLNDGMYKVEGELLNALVKCVLPVCRDVIDNLSELRTNIDFSKLPDVLPTLNQFKDLDTEALMSAVNEGMGKMNRIEIEIKTKLDENLQKVTDQVKDAGAVTATYLNNMTESFEHIQREFIPPNSSLPNLDMIIKSERPFIYYWGLAISCLLLLVTVCIALGLICGICGKRAAGYSDYCCNKGAGSRFLTCSVITMIIFGIFLALVVLTSFMLGIFVDRKFCYPMRNPEHSKIVDMNDNPIERQFIPPIRKSDFKYHSKQLFSRCYKNESIYNVFSLNYTLDIDPLLEKFNVSSYLDQMLEQLNGILDNDFEILSKENKKTLESLKMVHPSINFDQFQDELQRNLGHLSFEGILEKLRQLVATNAEDPHINMIKKEVSTSILQINTYKEKLLMPMKEKADMIIDVAKHLNLELSMNSTSFPAAITKLLTKIKEAEEVLKNNGTQILKKAAKDFGTILLNQVDSYVYRAENVLKNKLGQCGPLNVAINATVIATCDKILLPWNGYWFALFLSLILFVPTIIVSDKMATLYQNGKQYGQFVETRSNKCDEKKLKKAKLMRNAHRIWEKATRLLENTRRDLTRQTPDDTLIVPQNNNKVDSEIQTDARENNKNTK